MELRQSSVTHSTCTSSTWCLPCRNPTAAGLGGRLHVNNIRLRRLAQPQLRLHRAGKEDDTGSKKLPDPQPGTSNNRDPGKTVDNTLESLWETTKKELKGTLQPEEAKLVESLSYEELLDWRRLLQKLVDTGGLSTVLEALGITDDPVEFVVDMLKLSVFLMFLSCGFLFYGTETIGHFDAGEALRATAGLSIGYLTRPWMKVEQIFAPIYNWLLPLLVPQADQAGTIYGEQQSEVAQTINKLGITVAVLTILPATLWHWTQAECVHFIVPVAAGWFMFDLCLFLAVALQVNKRT